MAENTIGIITLHRNTNYGANLQAFASCRFLNDHGIPCRVIDYLPPEQDWENHISGILSHVFQNEKRRDSLRLMKLTASLVFFSVHRSEKLRSFERFRAANIPLTQRCDSIEDVENLRLKTIVCGSDQIWNAEITEGIRDVYYGRVAGVEKRIAYAASVGGYHYPEAELEHVHKLIRGLDYCSAREENTRDYIESISGQVCEHVCDPVFLLDKDEFCAVASPRLVKEQYVLLYGVISNSTMSAAAQQYAREKGLQLIEIGGDGDPRVKHKQFAGAGPDGFLSAILYAQVVFTNSFHGAALSIVMEKDFFVFQNPHGGSRLSSLLETAGLSERIVSEKTGLRDYPSSIDYEPVRDRMKDFIQKSRDFLLNSVRAETKLLVGDACVGCGACEAVCGKDALRLVRNLEGFPYAVQNTSKCVNCNLCTKVCPTLESADLQPIQKVYAFKAADGYRINSTSGGAFSAAAECILQRAGVVYGAAMDGVWSVQHERAATEEELKNLRGVKYVQSDMSGCFEQIKQDLLAGRPVLFTGTPCQVSAVKNYSKICKLPTEKLYLVDIICHGVPSPRVFSDYIRWLEGRLGSKVQKYQFRDKRVSWRGNSASALLEDGRWVHASKLTDAYMNTYYSGAMTRESCYRCQYTSTNRVSDMTISDFWGIEKKEPSFEDALGVSMLLVNTEKGARLFRELHGEKSETDLSNVRQPQLHDPCEKPLERDAFWREYREKGIDHVLLRYGGLRSENRIKALGRKLLHR